MHFYHSWDVQINHAKNLCAETRARKSASCDEAKVQQALDMIVAGKGRQRARRETKPALNI